MILENEKVRKEKLYTVGYNSNLNKYILACVVNQKRLIERKLSAVRPALKACKNLNFLALWVL